MDEKDIDPRCGATGTDTSTRYQLYARIEPKGGSWIVCAATLTDLTQRASERAVRQISPYRLAVYFGRRGYPAPASKEDLARIREIVDEMLRNDAADQHEWGLNLSGLLHGRSARDYAKENRPEEAKAEYERAADDFELAYRLEPDFSPAYINRGWALFRLKNYEASIEQYNKSISIRKARGVLPYSDSYTGLGFVYLERGDGGDLDKAIENFEQARQIEPSYVDGRYDDDPYLGLAQAWQTQERSQGKYQGKSNEQVARMLEERPSLRSMLSPNVAFGIVFKKAEHLVDLRPGPVLAMDVNTVSPELKWFEPGKRTRTGGIRYPIHVPGGCRSSRSRLASTMAS